MSELASSSGQPAALFFVLSTGTFVPYFHIMNFMKGIAAGIIAMAALVEWRTGIFHDLVKLRNWNPFQNKNDVKRENKNKND